jgi:transposase
MKNYNTLKKIFENEIIHSNIKPQYILDDIRFKVLNSYETEKFIGYEVSLTEKTGICSFCGQVIHSGKDTKYTYPNYGIINDKSVILKVVKKLLYCPYCNKSTAQEVFDVLPKQQKSEKIVNLIRQKLVDSKATYASAARKFNVSVTNIIYQFDKFEYSTIDLSTIDVISIDEVRFIPSAGNYQCIISDPKSGNILKILNNRYYQTVKDYLKKNLSHITYQTQDFWPTYRSCAKQNNIQTIVDKFHFVRFGMWGYNRTRVEIQKEFELKLMRS